MKREIIVSASPSIDPHLLRGALSPRQHPTGAGARRRRINPQLDREPGSIRTKVRRGTRRHLHAAVRRVEREGVVDLAGTILNIRPLGIEAAHFVAGGQVAPPPTDQSRNVLRRELEPNPQFNRIRGGGIAVGRGEFEQVDAGRLDRDRSGRRSFVVEHDGIAKIVADRIARVEDPPIRTDRAHRTALAYRTLQIDEGAARRQRHGTITPRRNIDFFRLSIVAANDREIGAPSPFLPSGIDHQCVQVQRSADLDHWNAAVELERCGTIEPKQPALAVVKRNTGDSSIFGRGDRKANLLIGHQRRSGHRRSNRHVRRRIVVDHCDRTGDVHSLARQVGRGVDHVERGVFRHLRQDDQSGDFHPNVERGCAGDRIEALHRNRRRGDADVVGRESAERHLCTFIVAGAVCRNHVGEGRISGIDDTSQAELTYRAFSVLVSRSDPHRNRRARGVVRYENPRRPAAERSLDSLRFACNSVDFDRNRFDRHMRLPIPRPGIDIEFEIGVLLNFGATIRHHSNVGIHCAVLNGEYLLVAEHNSPVGADQPGTEAKRLAGRVGSNNNVGVDRAVEHADWIAVDQHLATRRKIDVVEGQVEADRGTFSTSAGIERHGCGCRSRKADIDGSDLNFAITLDDEVVAVDRDVAHRRREAKHLDRSGRAGIEQSNRFSVGSRRDQQSAKCREP